MEQTCHTKNLALPAFNARLRTLRRAKGLKQQALADFIGVNQTTISRWERGDLIPDTHTAESILQSLTTPLGSDEPLLRLVTSSRNPVHLIDDTSHRCLAASPSRLAEWQKDISDVIGRCLWTSATPEIEAAETGLEAAGWWQQYAPLYPAFFTSALYRDGLNITASILQWDRLYLSDGTPVRLCTSTLLPA